MAALKQLFAVPAEECAVCIPDGAQLRLSGISASIQRRHGVSEEEPVTFRQLSADAATYRDAVEFRNGEKVRLQELDEGQSFDCPGSVFRRTPCPFGLFASGCRAALANVAESKSMVGI